MCLSLRVRVLLLLLLCRRDVAGMVLLDLGGVKPTYCTPSILVCVCVRVFIHAYM